ncbi:MAG: TetR family transcriptional regulator C-terminal domain-containing protein [Lactobacillus sp.]|jgi:AcrR family transcriptional regulator|nr:TetR family transcriptional regulator C-terminal domain-containing protein [Lactobacillus sp.]
MNLTGTPAQLKMFEALGVLLNQLPMHQVSITEIIKTAGVSRSTFYLYYTDFSAFIQDLENRLLKHVDQTQKRDLKSAINATAISPDFNTAYPVFLALVKGIEDNFPLFKALTEQDNSRQFIETFQLSLSETLFANLEENMENKAFFQGIPADYAMPIFFSTILTIILHWLHKKNPEPAAIVARLITRSRYVAPYELFKPKAEP